MKIKTKELKTALSVLTSVIKYVNIKPMTSMIEMYAENKKLQLRATNGTTKICAELEVDEDIDNFVINVLDLYKLVKLTTKDEISFKFCDGYIEVRGNGKYKMNIITDESGDRLELPFYMDHITTQFESVDPKAFNEVKTFTEIAVCQDDRHDEFMKYYSNGSKIMTTDSHVIAVLKDGKLPMTEVAPYVMNQICKFCDCDTLEYAVSSHGNFIRILAHKDDILFDSQVDVDTHTKPFPIELVEGVINKPMYACKIEDIAPKELIDAVKRLEIFQSSLSLPHVTLRCVEGLEVTNVKNVEEYLGGTVVKEAEVSVNISIEKLIAILKNIKDNVSIHIGSTAIKIENDKVLYIISRMGG